MTLPALLRSRLLPYAFALWMPTALIDVAWCDDPASSNKVDEVGEKKDSPPQTADETKERSPEDTLVELLTAMLAEDSQRILAVIIPNPEASLLWKSSDGMPPRPKPPALMRPFIEAQIKQTKWRRLKIGEEVRLPDGHAITMTKKQINDDRLQLTSDDSPIPFTLVRENGDWKVDAGPLIASRKAGETYLREHPEELQRLQKQ